MTDADDDELDERLLGDRPVPDPQFRGALGRSIAADPRHRVPHRPTQLWFTVALLAIPGIVVLVLALLLS